MPDINSLARRIDAEFAAVEEKAKEFQSEQVEQNKQRESSRRLVNEDRPDCRE